MRELPEVDHVNTIDTLLPTDQDEKLQVIEDATEQLRGVLKPKAKAAPSDADTARILALAAKTLRQIAGRSMTLPVARFADALDALAKSGSPNTRRGAGRRVRGF